MNIQRLSRSRAEEVYNSLQHMFKGEAYHINLPPEYERIREDLIRLFQEFKQYQDYQFDYRYALAIYRYFSSQNHHWFTLSLSADYDFWRYLSLVVVPDLVYQRHGTQKEYYYGKDVRIYLSTMWWYAHMSWQGSMEETEMTIENNTTDTILNLVERPGKKGVHLQVYRSIMKLYGLLGKIERRVSISDSDSEMTSVNVTLFRRVMTLHTAKSQVINPDLYECGALGYARMLFSSVGVRIGGEECE